MSTSTFPSLTLRSSLICPVDVLPMKLLARLHVLSFSLKHPCCPAIQSNTAMAEYLAIYKVFLPSLYKQRQRCLLDAASAIDTQARER